MRPNSPLGPIIAAVCLLIAACGSSTSTDGALVPSPAVTLQASPSSVNPGSAATLTWSATYAAGCTASGAWSGSRPTSGTESTGSLGATSSYTLSCQGDGGTSSQTVTVTVSQDPLPPTVTLTASPDLVAPGNASTLSWTATDATTCTASGGWSGSRPVAGSETTPALSTDTSFTLQCTGAGGSVASTIVVRVNSTGSSSRFPLRKSANGRYIEDQEGTPFLLHGDTAWSLLVQLSREDVNDYLEDRHARGFNTLLMNLIEHKFADNPPRNWYGDPPFLAPGDFSTPNEAYFAHADWVIGRARELGFVVLLVPAYLGYGGGDEGWYQDLIANSAAALRGYGTFLGQRYRDADHVIWTHGGDYDPPDRSVVRLIADGIHAPIPGRLATAHGARETVPADFWAGESWLTLNNVYTGGPVFSAALSQFQRPGPVPFFFIEGIYENEQSSTIVRIRTQAYHALLSGAAGQVFGNNPIWSFDGPRIYPTNLAWREALDGPGSRSMSHLWTLFSSHAWWTLVPDAQNDLLTAGLGDGQQRAVAALSADGGLAIAYVPTQRDIRINLSMLAGPNVDAHWFDPSSGGETPVAGFPVPAGGSLDLATPGANSSGAGDWVLVLQSAE